MYFNKFIKFTLLTLATKLSRVPVKLPIKPKERVDYLYKLIQDEEIMTTCTVEDFVKVNSLLLLIMWFSEENFPTELYILALENIVDKSKTQSDIEKHLVLGVTMPACYQGLIRNYIESPSYSLEKIECSLTKYSSEIGYLERLALLDEELAFKAHKGEFQQLVSTIDELLRLPKGEQSDCYACIITRLINYCILAQEIELGQKLVDKIYKEKLTCDGVPNKTVIQKLYLEKTSKDTRKHMKEAFKSLKKNNDFFFEAALLLEMAKEYKEDSIGKKVLAVFDPLAKENFMPSMFYYYTSAYIFSGDTQYYHDAKTIAEQYDARNKNEYYQLFLDKQIKAI